MPRHRCVVLVILLGLDLTSPASAGLVFNFSSGDGSLSSGDAMWDGFQDAADIWSSELTDNVTINLDIRTAALGPGVLGSAGSTRNTFTYSAFKTALTNDATSVDDATVTSNLPAGAAFDVYINHVVENGGAAFLDDDGGANNTTIRMTRANAKAVGLVGGTDATIDAEITFSSNFSWDFDPSNGITGGTYDFVGVATHEIGHALGFVSGVDVLDGNADGFSDDAFTWVSPVDLMRYSQTSADLGAIDFRAGNDTKSWSLDGGQTAVTGATFSTGRNLGDGQQASHWKDNQGVGLLDPTIASGEVGTLSENDKRMFDAIGWNLSAALSAVATTALATGGEDSGSGGGAGAAPEPVFLAYLALLVLALHLTRRPDRRCRHDRLPPPGRPA